MNHVEVAFGVLASVAALAMASFALPLSVKLAKGITLVSTLGLDEELRADRIADLEAYIYDLTDDLRKQGYRPVEIAFHLFWRTILGLGDELVWRMSRSSLLVAKICLEFATVGAVYLIVDAVVEEAANAASLMSREPVVVAVIAGLILTGILGALILVKSLIQLHILIYRGRSARLGVGERP